MSVWLTIPSKRPPEEAEKTLGLWRERGYKIALFRDSGDGFPRGVDYCARGPYEGYARTVNHLIGAVMHEDSSAEWFIAAGDDVEPDPNHSAEEINAQCWQHFHEGHVDGFGESCYRRGTNGVMQPTGDRWGDRNDGKGAYIDRVCGSAWIGREFARRMYQGKGPLWPEYYHMFVDEELQEVAIKNGLLWQRPDLIHRHNHWGRGPVENINALQNRDTAMPGFLKRANSAEEWRKAKELFTKRKAAGFPGSEPL